MSEDTKCMHASDAKVNQLRHERIPGQIINVEATIIGENERVDQGKVEKLRHCAGTAVALDFVEHVISAVGLPSTREAAR